MREIVHGGSRVIDLAAGDWARNNKMPVRVFRPDFKRHRTEAADIRNRVMYEYSDALVVIWDGVNRGPKLLIELAESLRLGVYIHRYPLKPVLVNKTRRLFQ
jgi:hypothetical protein